MANKFLSILWNKLPEQWRQRAEKRIRDNLKGQYAAESEEQLQRRTKKFLLQQGKILMIEVLIGILLFCGLLFSCAFSSNYILLDRNSFGQGMKEVQLSLKKDNKKKKITYKLDEQKMSSKKKQEKYRTFFKKLKQEMAGKNPSLAKVSMPLDFPETIEDYPFQITYELSEDGYIHLDGTLNEEAQRKLNTGEYYETYIIATARYRAYKASKKYKISIVSKEVDAKHGLFYQVQQYLQKKEKQNPYSSYVKIPSSYGKVKIQPEQKGEGISGIIILFIVVGLFIPVHNYLKLQEAAEKCQKEAERDFPVIVHLLTLYMGAGLSFFSAIRRIGYSYRKQREADVKRQSYAFEKILLMEQQMNNGMSQKEACQNWGMQFKADMYQKLSLILIQSFTKGSKEAAMLMEAEEREAFRKRVHRAKEEGEEAATRLLFPMILLLGQVMLLVMYPALIRFQGF